MQAYMVENGQAKLAEMPAPAGAKIAVKAVGVNRADVFHLAGKYPAFGMEFAGLTESGERVCGLMDNGAYAEFVSADEAVCLTIPPELSFEQAASLLEALVTAYYNLVDLCQLKAGEKVLIHGGGSGVGVVAIQLATLLGAEVFATAGKAQKLALIEELTGVAIDYTKQNFAEQKYDVILDIVGAEYFNKNLSALNQNGRLAIISFIGGAKVEQANIAPLLTKNLHIFGSTIRSLSKLQKQNLLEQIAPYLPKIAPVVDRVFAFNELPQALQYVEKYQNVGKVVIQLD